MCPPLCGWIRSGTNLRAVECEWWSHKQFVPPVPERGTQMPSIVSSFLGLAELAHGAGDLSPEMLRQVLRMAELCFWPSSMHPSLGDGTRETRASILFEPLYFSSLFHSTYISSQMIQNVTLSVHLSFMLHTEFRISVRPHRLVFSCPLKVHSGSAWVSLSQCKPSALPPERTALMHVCVRATQFPDYLDTLKFDM